jgi:ABC-2 type transport system permease protein
MTRSRGNRAALINQGFDVVQLDLQGQRVPDDVTVLVIADPKQALTADALQINEYIERGGNVLIAVDPGGQALLNPLFETLGVQFMAGNLLQQNPDLPPDFVVAMLVDSAVKRADSDHGLFDERSGVNRRYLFSNQRVSMPLAMGIRQLENGPFDFHPVMAAAAQPHGATPVPVAVGLTRRLKGKEQRLLVVGDADFMSNQELARTNIHVANETFALETFKWLSYGEFPVDTTRPLAKDKKLLVTREGISAWKAIFCGVLPGLMALMGAAILVRRRRRE